ncbi:hypothetical protein HYW32_00195 [Candidatus Berkelbacteria bacterium]|nr:hypothetical protein [Candidatus Berkelbacteria bacterium]
MKATNLAELINQVVMALDGDLGSRILASQEGYYRLDGMNAERFCHLLRDLGHCSLQRSDPFLVRSGLFDCQTYSSVGL